METVMKLVEEYRLELVRDEPPLWKLTFEKNDFPEEGKNVFPHPGVEVGLLILAAKGYDPNKYTVEWENKFEGEKYFYLLKVMEIEIVDMIPDGIDEQIGEALMDDNIPGPKENQDPWSSPDDEDDPYGLFK
jgi:hypothetical protein